MSRYDELRAAIFAKRGPNVVERALVEYGVKRALGREVKRINSMSKLKSLAVTVRDAIAEAEDGAEKLHARAVKFKASVSSTYGKLHEEFDEYEDATIDNTSIISGQTVNLTGFSVTEAGA